MSRRPETSRARSRAGRRRGLARLGTLLAVAAVAAGTGTGCATGDRVTDRQYGQQYVCHDGEKTLAVSTADMFVHQQHGDSLGPCPHDG